MKTGPGRKPIKDKKEQFPIYLRQSEVKRIGHSQDLKTAISRTKEIIYKLLDEHQGIKS